MRAAWMGAVMQLGSSEFKVRDLSGDLAFK
jgi:hypothetical protein